MSDRPDSGFESRKLDAEKAIDEAKYKARTSKDIEILRVLHAWNGMIDVNPFKSAQMLGDRQTRKMLWDGSLQCYMEIQYEFEPDRLSLTGKETALKKLCVATRDQISKRLDSQVNKIIKEPKSQAR